MNRHNGISKTQRESRLPFGATFHSKYMTAQGYVEVYLDKDIDKNGITYHLDTVTGEVTVFTHGDGPTVH